MLEPGQTLRVISNDAVIREVLPTDDGLGELDTYFIPSHGQDGCASQHHGAVQPRSLRQHRVHDWPNPGPARSGLQRLHVGLPRLR